MSARVYTAVINDKVAGPALEILRSICQPSSRSLPHITIRYESDDASEHDSDLYDRNGVIPYLTLEEPGTFDSAAADQSSSSTVFLRCAADEFEWLAYKPDFPDSFFHATIYDGPKSELANKTLEILRKYPWGLSVDMSESRIGRGSLKKPKSEKGTVEDSLTPEAWILLSDLVHKRNLDVRAIFESRTPEKLYLAEQVCELLHRKLIPSGVSSHIGRLYHPRPGGRASQGELWAIPELTPLARQSQISRDEIQSGLVTTPPEVAIDILARCRDLMSPVSEVFFGDPAIGSGIFFAAAVREFGDRLVGGVGIESNGARAALTSRRWRSRDLSLYIDHFIDRALGTSEQTGGASEQSGQSSPVKWGERRPNLLVANPPYVRTQGIDPRNKLLWTKALADRGFTVSRSSDLYLFFLLASHDWLDDEGLAAWLLPAEFLFTIYGSAIRNYLTDSVELLHIHLYSGRSRFSNARVSSCVVFFKKRTSDRMTFDVQFSVGSRIEAPDRTRFLSLKTLRGAGKWQVFFRENLPAFPDNSKSHVTVGDLFRVRRGMATGANSLFLLTGEEVEALQIQPEWVRPVVPRPRYLTGPVIQSDSRGIPVVEGLKWVINCNLPLEALESIAPAFAAYLRNVKLVAGDRTLLRRRKIFYLQEKLDPAPFLFTYMAKVDSIRGRFYINTSAGVALNNYLCLYPVSEVLDWIGDDFSRQMQILRMLRSLSGEQMSNEGRVYVEGLSKLEPREMATLELEAVPLSLLDVLIRSGNNGK